MILAIRTMIKFGISAIHLFQHRFVVHSLKAKTEYWIDTQAIS